MGENSEYEYCHECERGNDEGIVKFGKLSPCPFEVEITGVDYSEADKCCEECQPDCYDDTQSALRYEREAALK